MRGITVENPILLTNEIMQSKEYKAIHALYDPEKKRRNRANLAAHIAYTKRKGTPCPLTKSATPKP